MSTISKKYRLNTKSFFLTYPRCTLTKEQALTLLQDKLDIQTYYISREDHKDGTPHIHAFIKTHTKHNFLNPNCLDLNEFHGNYQSAREKQKVIGYVCKHGDFICNYYLDKSNPNGYIRRRNDFEAWQQDINTNLPHPTFPFTLFGNTIQEPNPNTKKRHLWVIGAPNTGKTTTFWETVGRTKIWIAIQGHPFERINDHKIILYDDLEPTLPDLLGASNTYPVPYPVPGGSRYQPSFFPAGTTRTIIIFSNTRPLWTYNEALTARFNFFYLPDNLPTNI